MNDTKLSNPQESLPINPWLIFIPQIPPKPDYLRVKLRRRIQKIGAVSLRNAVYVLPDRDGCVEDFVWLRSELKGDAAEAIVLTCSVVAGVSDADMVKLFNEARNADYRAVIDDAAAISSSDADLEREATRLKRRVDEIAKVDFFDAPEKVNAEAAVSALFGEHAASPSNEVAKGGFSGRTWVTRAGVFVDRIASAWLIRRFIDSSPTFKFVDAAGYKPEPGEIRFDMYDGEYTHVGDRCTFEVLLDRFVFKRDSALEAIAEIVHDIDLKDGKFNRPEAHGIESILAGISAATGNDEERITRASPIFDGLYSKFGVQI